MTSSAAPASVLDVYWRLAPEGDLGVFQAPLLHMLSQRRPRPGCEVFSHAFPGARQGLAMPPRLPVRSASGQASSAVMLRGAPTSRPARAEFWPPTPTAAATWWAATVTL